VKKLVFVEGVSGVGKSTAVRALGERLTARGHSVCCYLEGDSASPLDLCWVAHFEKADYARFVAVNEPFQEVFERNRIDIGSDVLLRYRDGEKDLYTQEIMAEVQMREFCYPPPGVPLQKFQEVFLGLWRRYVESNMDASCDYAVFDASLIGHTASDMLRSYNASIETIAHHVQALAACVQGFHPMALYLSSDDIGVRLAQAGQSQGQEPPTQEQTAFWTRRKAVDLAVLSRIPIKTHIIDITDGCWDSAYDEMMEYVVDQ